MKQNPYNQDDASDELCRQILMTARADQEEIDAAVNSPFLFQRIRNQIATEGNLSHQAANTQPRNLFSSLVAGFNWRWGWAIPATALVVFGFVMLASRSNSKTDKPNVIAVNDHATPLPVTPTVKPSGDQIIDNTPRNLTTVKASYQPSMKRPQNKISHSRFTKEKAAEATTDFLPLTYLSDETAADSGHVVRVEVPRTMMASMGVPTNRERQSELVKADVIIGDDGLARAIRFVQ